VQRRRTIALSSLLILAAGIALWRWSDRRRESSQDVPIYAAATRYGVDPALVKAVVWRESNFNPLARGRAGELGLMQLRDVAAQEWAESVRAYPLPESHLLDPRTNTLAGTWLLRKTLQRYRGTDNPIPYALAEYNAGRANVLKWAKGHAATNSTAFLVAIGFPATRDYINAILDRLAHYRRQWPAVEARPR
jgi:soluble lytic murein transglycosylase